MVNYCAAVKCTDVAVAGSRWCVRHVSPKAMTAKQALVLEFIKTYIADRTYPPTVQEIGRGLKIGSKNTVFQYLARLERAGYIEREFGKARGIRLIGGEHGEPI